MAAMFYSCYPPLGTPSGTPCLLVHRFGTRTVFEWTEGAWMTPGTGWGTLPEKMQALGWLFGEVLKSTAIEDSAEAACIVGDAT